MDFNLRLFYQFYALFELECLYKFALVTHVVNPGVTVYASNEFLLVGIDERHTEIELENIHFDWSLNLFEFDTVLILT